MTQSTRQTDPLAESVRSEQEEIAKYKWIESEKAGHDIGESRAIEEWLHKHFAQWVRYQRGTGNRALAEAFPADEPQATSHGGRN